MGLYFFLFHFVVPFYLVYIYPEVPEPAARLMRGMGYGLIEGPPSQLGFWYRFVACGAWVFLGYLILSYRIRKFAHKDGERSDRKSKRKR